MKLFNSSKRSEITSSNVLFLIALKQIDTIETDYQKLSEKGRCEALIFISIFIYNKALEDEDIKNDLLIDEFLLIIAQKVKNLMAFKSIGYVKDFVNERFRFYLSEYEKNCNETLYTPMFIYNAIYLNPFAKKPQDIKTFNINPVELMEFYLVLRKVVYDTQTHSVYNLR